MTSTIQSKYQRNSDSDEVTANYYLTNATLLPEVVKCKAEGKISDALAKMLLILAKRNASRPAFSGYTYRDDMVAEALVSLCKNALKFDPERSDNPFAYYTTCITNSFWGYTNHEKKHRRIRDQLLVDLGESPSFSFQDEYRLQLQNAGLGKEFTELQEDISNAKERQLKEAEMMLKAEALKAPADRLLDFDDTAEELNFEETYTNQKNSDDNGHPLWEEGQS